MSDSKFKPSFGIETLLSGDLAVESEKFLSFIKAYYEWMQTSKIGFTDKVGTFIYDETIIGATVGATAKIKEIGIDDDLIVSIETRIPFNLYETITGQTSGATATISSVVDNVVRRTGKLLDYRNIETSIDTYVDYLKDELYPSVPITYYGNKRLIASKFREFFKSKSNEQSYRFLFKLLYNENIEFYYPGGDILRVSDGNFEKTEIIRTISVSADTRNIFLFLNKTIRGQTSGVLANVVDIKKFFVGAIEIAEMTLKLVSGTFTAGEDIVDIEDEDLSTTIYGIVSSVIIVDGGSGYEEGDIITITGDGLEAQAKISSIKESPISALKINTIGHGYQLNTEATINNSGTGGTGFIFKVSELANTYTVTSGANTYTVGEISRLSIINRGEGYFKKPTVTLQDTIISSLGLLSNNLITIVNAGSNYGVGNTLIFTGGAGTGAAGQIASVTETTTFDLLFEDGQRMLADGSYYDIIKNQDWSVKGPIKRIELTNFGTGYTSANLPSITISTTTGSSANLVATNIQGKSANVSIDTSNNITGIGSIRSVEITNFGINYSTANASTSTVGDGNANVTVTISGLGIKEGVLLNDDGKIDYKIIQDSYYYQDYSYVIRSGLVFSAYRDTLKSIIHPAGLQAFGEILIKSIFDVTPIISSTIDILSNVNEYILSILSIFDISPSVAQSKYTRIMSSIANTSSSLVSGATVQFNITPSTLNTTSTFNSRTLGIIKQSQFDASSSFAQSIYPRIISSAVDTSTSLLENREVQVHIAPSTLDTTSTFNSRTLGIITQSQFDLSSDISDQYILSFPLQFDAYESSSLLSDREVQVNITPSALQTEATFNSRTLGIITQSQFDISSDISDQYILSFPLQFDAYESSSLVSNTEVQIYIPPSALQTEATFNSRTLGIITQSQFDLSSDISDQYILSIPSQFDAYESSSLLSDKEFQIYIPPSALQTEATFDSRTLGIITQSQFNISSDISDQYILSIPSQFLAYGTIYADSIISNYANTLISTLSSFAFDTVFTSEPNVTGAYNKNIKITGTVTFSGNNVIGTGTSFANNFSIDDSFIVNNEKFIVKSVANSTHLQVNVNPVGSYTNVLAYKQQVA